MADLEPPVAKYKLNRQKIIEAAATAIHDAACTFHSDRGISVGHYSIEMHAAQDAALVLPVIVVAALKPIRELHRPHPYADAELRSVSPSLPEFVCTHCATPSGRAVAFPCPTVRLLDQIETDSKGGE